LNRLEKYDKFFDMSSTSGLNPFILKGLGGLTDSKCELVLILSQRITLTGEIFSWQIVDSLTKYSKMPFLNSFLDP
jgi:hypothetical protein